VRPLFLAFVLVGCSGSPEPAETPGCGLTIAEYCRQNDCVLDGMRSTADFRAWCARAGKLAAGADGLSSCETHMIIDVRTGAGVREFYYDKQTGELTWVRDLATSPATCAGAHPPGCVTRSGVGVSCSSPI